jgi:hypothetical protein
MDLSHLNLEKLLDDERFTFKFRYKLASMDLWIPDELDPKEYPNKTAFIDDLKRVLQLENVAI